jgi:hypothetical protein
MRPIQPTRFQHTDSHALSRRPWEGLLKEETHPVVETDVSSLTPRNYLDFHEVYIATALCRSRPPRCYGITPRTCRRPGRTEARAEFAQQYLPWQAAALE